MSKWSFGNAILVKYCSVPHCTLLVLKFLMAKINHELYTFLNFFNQGTNL